MARQLLVNLENSQIVIEIVVTWYFGVLSSRSGRLLAVVSSPKMSENLNQEKLANGQ